MVPRNEEPCLLVTMVLCVPYNLRHSPSSTIWSSEMSQTW